MAGVILETLSNRKLLGFAICILICQIVVFLLGGLIAPAPSNVITVTATICVDHDYHQDKGPDPKKWFVPRGPTDVRCDSLSGFEDPKIDKYRVDSEKIVFSMLFPHVRDNVQLDMSRWQQSLISILDFTIVYDQKIARNSGVAKVTMDVKLGYKNKQDAFDGNWTELISSSEDRQMMCNVTKSEDGYPLNCDVLPLFELGSCHHDYYLLNLRLPVDYVVGKNIDIGALTEITAHIIHQNGGFTKVWFSIKTVFFPIILGVLSWYWRRIQTLERSPTLLERTLFALGITLSFLNIPIEFLTLWFDMPYMLLISDIRQGIFYSMLLSFWIIFTGEHLMDKVDRNRLSFYWKHLGAVGVGCICLFVFDMCERGVQLTNPFFTIWATQTGTRLALAFISLAGLSACCYFFLLCYMVYKVFRNISNRKGALPQMNKARRKYYMGLIYRFKFLMLTTLLCAAISVIFFIISQVSEGHWKWGEEKTLEYTSAFLCGTYGMWNLYTFSLLILYAPSHKQIKNLDLDDDDSQENMMTELTLTVPAEGPTETSGLASFAKAAAD